MKRKAALIVCGILAASFAAGGVSDHRVLAVSGGKEASSGSSATLNMTDELRQNLSSGSTASAEAASTGSGTEEEQEEAGNTDSTEAATAGTTSAEEETADTEDAAAEGSSTEAAEEADAAAEEADASYFKLSIPDDWEDAYTLETAEKDETSENPDGAVYEQAYYEQTAHDAGDGGLLVRIALYQSRKGYLSLPDYTYLGDLQAEDGTLYAVIAEFPSDVQFSIEAREQYNQMAAEIPALLRSLEGADGYTFHAGRTRTEQKAEEAWNFGSLLDQFLNAGALANGTMIDTSQATGGTNQYAILDVDGDGADELVLKIGSPAASDKTTRASGPAEGDADEAAAGSTEAEADAEAEAGTDTAESAADTDADADAADSITEAESGSADRTAEVQAEAVNNTDEEQTDTAEDTEAAEAEDSTGNDYYDSFAASNYYIFRGNADDSHAAHMSADEVEEILKNTTEEYTQTVYDIEWQNITRGEVNRLYNEACVPVWESAEHQKALRRRAFREALSKLVNDNQLPDGTAALPYENVTTEDMEENDFAIADVDADGYDELLIRVTNTDAASSRELVYSYDEEEDTLLLEFDGVPGGVVYYDNGTLRSEARYDNNTPSRLWPYQLAAYNMETGAYESKGSVTAWDQDVMRAEQGRTVDALSESFPTETDADGNGRIYFLQDRSEDAGNTDVDAVDDDVVDSWYESVVGSGSSAVYIDWYPVSEDNMQTALYVLE